MGAQGGAATLPLPQRLELVAQIADALARERPQDPFQELQHQNQELVRALEEIRTRQQELMRLNRELEDTNRGVVALYAELDEWNARLAELRAQQTGTSEATAS